MLIFFVVWFGCGIMSYLLVRLSVYIVFWTDFVEYETAHKMKWTHFHFIFWFISCLIFGWIGLSCMIVCILVLFSLYGHVCIKRGRRNKNSWWNEESKL